MDDSNGKKHLLRRVVTGNTYTCAQTLSLRYFSLDRAGAMQGKQGLRVYSTSI